MRRQGISLLAATVTLAVLASVIPASAQAAPPGGAVTAVLASALLGDRVSFTMLRRDLSDRSQLAINAATGNVVYEATDLRINGVGQNLEVRRYFNSGSSASRTLPAGWNLSVGADSFINFTVGGTVTYHAPDGSLYPFARGSDGSYTSPSGINAKLSTSDQVAFQLRFNKTGITDNFTAAAVPGGAANAREGNIASSVDRDGNRIVFGYAQPSGAPRPRLATITDTQARVVQFGYDTSSRLASITDNTGRQVIYSYATDGTLAAVRDGAGKTTAYGYAGGNLTAVQSPDQHRTVIGYGDTADPDRATSVTYGADAADASRTTFAYPNGTTTQVTDPLNHTTTYSYDARGRVTRVVDPLGHPRATSYTANDDPTTLTDATTAVTNLSYDNQNNLTKVQAPDLDGGTAGSGRAALLGYPTPTGSLNDFLPSSSTDAQGNQTVYGYNTAGHLNSVKPADGFEHTSKYQGDSGVDCGGKPGELCTVNVDGDAPTNYAYDAAGNLTTISAPVAFFGPTVISPDGLGRQSQVTDGKGQATSFQYDGADRITQIRYAGATSCALASGNCINYGYDGAGHLTSRADAAGSTTYTYDAQGRLATRSFTGPVGSQQNTLTYDLAGNLASYTDPLGTVTYSYDAANRVVSLAEPGGSCATPAVFPNTTHCTGFSYDNNDRRTKITYPTGQVNAYSYDSSGRMTKVSSASGGTALRSETYGYTLNGKDTGLLQSRTPGGGTEIDYGYTKRNQLRSISSNGNDSKRWDYDIPGNVQLIETPLPRSPGPVHLGHDALNELICVGPDPTCPGQGNTVYTSDRNGNVASAGSTAYSYNARNQTTAIGDTTFTYADADSTERISRSTPAGTVTFLNGPLGVTGQLGAGQKLGFTRDPAGNLISLRVTTGTQSGYSSYGYFTDHLGSVLQVIDGGTNTAAADYTYDEFGAVTSRSGTLADTNPYRFASGMVDPTGLIKFGTRYYNPAVTSWTQRDSVAGSIADPNSLDPYVYASGQPTNRTDPTGRASACGKSIFGLVVAGGAIAAGVVAFATTPLDFGTGFIASVAAFEFGVADLPIALDSVAGSC